MTCHKLDVADADAKNETVPNEASEKVLWTIRRSWEIPSKVRHRLSSHAERQLHDLSVAGLNHTGTLIDFIEWVSLKLHFRNVHE